MHTIWEARCVHRVVSKGGAGSCSSTPLQPPPFCCRVSKAVHTLLPRGCQASNCLSEARTRRRRTRGDGEHHITELFLAALVLPAACAAAEAAPHDAGRGPGRTEQRGFSDLLRSHGVLFKCMHQSLQALCCVLFKCMHQSIQALCCFRT